MTRRALHCLAVLLPVFAVAWMMPGAAGAAEIVSRNLGGHCLDVSGGNFRAGTPIILYSCNRKPNQTWEIDDGDIDISAQIGWNACLGWDGPNDPPSGTLVVLRVCDSNYEKRWTISRGEIRTPSGKCVSAGLTNGAAVTLVSCGSRANSWAVR